MEVLKGPQRPANQFYTPEEVKDILRLIIMPLWVAYRGLISRTLHPFGDTPKDYI